MKKVDKQEVRLNINDCKNHMEGFLVADQNLILVIYFMLSFIKLYNETSEQNFWSEVKKGW